MSDLISRSELTKHFEAIQSQECAIGLDFVAMIDVIKEQPTAYDIDNVVLELKKLKDKGSVTKTEMLITKSCVNKAIEIVKAGVKNE